MEIVDMGRGWACYKDKGKTKKYTAGCCSGKGILACAATKMLSWMFATWNETLVLLSWKGALLGQYPSSVLLWLHLGVQLCYFCIFLKNSEFKSVLKGIKYPMARTNWIHMNVKLHFLLQICVFSWNLCTHSFPFGRMRGLISALIVASCLLFVTCRWS